jgi:hypothetical protein
LNQIKVRLGHTPVALQLQIGMEENFAKLAAHDEVGIKLQNIKLLGSSK